MKITADLVMSWHPCEQYTRERVEELCGGKSLSVCDVLRLPIPGADRLWVVLRRDVLPDAVLREFAAMCADIALTGERNAGREPDPRSWAAVEVALRHAAGDATDEELKLAAWSARSAAAWSAAWSAESAAESAAARDVQCEILYALCIERRIE